MTTFEDKARALDAADPIAPLRQRFHIPDGVIYLDGNSLGAMPHAAMARLAHVAGEEWGNGLIRSWNSADWIRMPLAVGNRIAPLIGVGADEVAVGDSTSVNLFKCLAAALKLQPGRKVILLESDNFPTDNYMAEGLATLLGDVELRYFASDEPIEPHLAADVAVLMLSHVHYRSAKIHDMTAVTRAAHAQGILVLWDLSHSTGAVKVDLPGADADFAVGCTYKYLNGGPGAPAFVWVAARHVEQAQQPLSGWMGHKTPFDFSLGYRPADAIKRFICGTPQVLSLSALDECLTVWADVELDQLFEKSRLIGDLFIEGVETECKEHGLTLQSPRDAAIRGSHVSFGIDNGYPVMRALIDRGVIGDFRAPDTIRFGFAPLYLSYMDIANAVKILRQILDERLWDVEAYKVRAAVT